MSTTRTGIRRARVTKPNGSPFLQLEIPLQNPKTARGYAQKNPDRTIEKPPKKVKPSPVDPPWLGNW